MIDQSTDDLIVKSAENFRLDANLIRAIVLVESGGNNFKCRFEPAWPSAYLVSPREYADKLCISLATETMLQSTSFGLMQILGSVSRERGFKLDLLMLSLTDIGLFYGCKQLRYLFDHIGDDEDHVICAYNGGLHVGKTPGGLYVNEKYLDKVHSELRKLRALQ